MVATTAILLLLLLSLCLVAQEPRKRDPAPDDAFEGAGASEGRITTTTTTFETGAADLDAAHDIADEGVAQAAGEDLESGRGELLSADVERG